MNEIQIEVQPPQASDNAYAQDWLYEYTISIVYWRDYKYYRSF